MKILGITLAIIGAVCTAIGYTNMNSWEYQVSTALGSTDTSPQALLYCGIAAVVLGLVFIALEYAPKEKGD